MGKVDLLQAKRCPHCGYAYETRLYGRLNADDNMVKFGKIYVTCPQCQRVFRNDDIYELAIMDPPKDYLSKFSAYAGSATVYALLGVFSVVISKYRGDLTSGIIGGIFMAIIAIYCLFKEADRYSNRVEMIKEERRRSVERIKNDPEYARMLQADGFRLPDGIEIPVQTSLDSKESQETPLGQKEPSGEQEKKASAPSQQVNSQDSMSLPHEKAYYSREGGLTDDNRRGVKRELLRYLSQSQGIYVFICTFVIISYIIVLFHFLDSEVKEIINLLLFCAIIMSIGALPCLVLDLKMRSRISKIEYDGELDYVLNDFSDASLTLGGRLRIGKDFVYGNGMVINYGDIGRLEVTYTNYLDVYLKSEGMKSHHLCSRDRVDDADLKKFIQFLIEKNPDMQIG